MRSPLLQPTGIVVYNNEPAVIFAGNHFHGIICIVGWLGRFFGNRLQVQRRALAGPLVTFPANTMGNLVCKYPW